MESKEKKNEDDQETMIPNKRNYENVKTKYATYVFEFPEEPKTSRVSLRMWQILPSISATFICVPFGMMLGWPSPAYPRLLGPDSAIHISMDQSAMIAGFLMIGNTLANPFSGKSIVCAKYGIIFGTVLMAFGWILMWQSYDIYGLLGSRLLVGIGYGYGLGQLKDYINQMCEEELAAKLIKQINLYVVFGLIVSFCIGPFTELDDYTLVCAIITVFVMFLTIFLPSTPRELIRANKVDVAKKLLQFLKPEANINEEVKKIYEKIDTYEENVGFSGIIKNAVLRKNFMIFGTLVFFQQFTGAPATLIYAQILFKESHVPNDKYFAICYSIVFFIANILGIYIMPRYNKRTVLLASSTGVILIDIIKIVVIYFKVNELHWNYTSVIVMYLFIMIHTLGLGNVPFTMISDLFPKNCRTFVTIFFNMFTSMGALVITKIFQVLLGQYNLYVPFSLFLCISVLSVIFVTVFVPKKL